MRGFSETDMVASLALFTIFIIIMSIFLAGSFTQFKSRADDEILEAQARDTLNMIASSPGSPSIWYENASSVSELGLSFHSFQARPGLLDFRKINASGGIEYSRLKELTNSEDIKVIIHDIELDETYVIGRDSARKNAASLERAVAIRYSYSNITKGRMTVILWK